MQAPALPTPHAKVMGVPLNTVFSGPGGSSFVIFSILRSVLCILPLHQNLKPQHKDATSSPQRYPLQYLPSLPVGATSNSTLHSCHPSLSLLPQLKLLPRPCKLGLETCFCLLLVFLLCELEVQPRATGTPGHALGLQCIPFLPF